MQLLYFERFVSETRFFCVIHEFHDVIHEFHDVIQEFHDVIREFHNVIYDFFYVIPEFHDHYLMCTLENKFPFHFELNGIRS